MKKLFLIILILIFVIIMIIMFSNGEHPFSIDISPTFVFGVIPLDGFSNPYGNFQHTFDYLEKSTGMTVIPFTANGYSGIVSAMDRGDVDVALLGGHSYVSAVNAGIPLEVFAIGIRSDTLQSTYHSIIISNKNNLESFEDLNTNANEQIFAFVDLLSTSGYLMPMEIMLTNNIHPKYDFQNVLIVNGHDNVVLAVHEQRATVGATSDITYNKMINDGIIDADEIIIIWKSEKIQGLPFVMRSDLPSDVKERIKSSFYTMGDNLEPGEFLGGWGDIIAYVPVQKSDYDYAFRAWDVLDVFLK